jgi:hypothetical protein
MIDCDAIGPGWRGVLPGMLLGAINLLMMIAI